MMLVFHNKRYGYGRWSRAPRLLLLLLQHGPGLWMAYKMRNSWNSTREKLRNIIMVCWKSLVVLALVLVHTL